MPTALASLSFLAPAWAGGLVGVLLPIAAHVLARRGGRSAVLPTARFARDAHAEARRAHRLRDAALLALRTAAVALVVLAFMQPVYRTDAQIAGPDTRARHVAVVLDRTASMQRTERGHRLFDRARRDAVAAITALGPADRASVVTLERQPRTLLPEPTANVAHLADQLRALEPTYEHGRVDEALQRARELHRRLPEPESRSLHVELFTDAQRTSWPDGAAAKAIDGVAPRVTMRVHRVGAFLANDALRGPAVVPAAPVAGQPARVTVRAMRYGHDGVQRTVELRVGAQRKARRVTLEPFSERMIDFEVTFPDAGAALVELAFVDGDDALPFDDVAGRVVRVREARRVHLLTGADADDPTRAAFFVRRALEPGDSRAGVRLERDTDGAGLSLAEAEDVAILVEAGDVPSERVAALRAHVARGGGAIWVIDSPGAATALAELDDAPIRPREADAWHVGSRALGTADFSDAVLEAFEGPARAALLDARFTRTLRGEPHPSARIVLSFADGEPALAITSIGDGRLAVLAADLAPESSDFVKGPMLVPLVHQLLRHIAPGPPPSPQRRPGEALPDGGRAGEPGLHVQQNADGTLHGGVWVELDPRESDLRQLDPADVSAAEGEGPVTAGAAAADAPRELALWPWAALAAVIALAVEPIVARGARWVENGATELADVA